LKISLLELFQSAFGKRDDKFRQRLSIFLVCVGISCIIWFTIKLSEEYDTVVEYPVRYTHLPKNKSLTFTSDSILQVEIIEKGSNLFRMLYVDKIEPVTINLRFLPIYPKGGSYHGIVTPSLLINEIERKKGLLGKIISISPDTIYLTFEPEKSRKVPVKADFDLTFDKEYMRYGNSVFKPDCVTVKGPERVIENLDSVSLGYIKLENLTDSFTGNKKFINDSINRTLSISPSEVSFIVPVEKYTETQVMVPVKPVNANGKNVRLFPDKVKVYCTVALKDYNRIQEGMIKAQADMSKADQSGDDKIKVSLENFPPFIRVNRIEPEKVEYIIVR